jgi:hypothetical protein
MSFTRDGDKDEVHQLDSRFSAPVRHRIPIGISRHGEKMDIGILCGKRTTLSDWNESFMFASEISRECVSKTGPSQIYIDEGHLPINRKDTAFVMEKCGFPPRP